jgi:hypothetical protein
MSADGQTDSFGESILIVVDDFADTLPFFGGSAAVSAWPI